MRIRTLVMQRRYFGLEPRAFRAGAARAVARASVGSSGTTHLNAQSVAEDFGLDAKRGTALLHALASAGLLQSSKNGNYQPTTRLRQYAEARIVVPLSRERARLLVQRAAALAARVNTHSMRNPLRIHTILVSGSYMSRHEKLTELTLWVVVRPRATDSRRRWGGMLTKADGAQLIVAKLRSLSPFIVVRFTLDASAVERPFAAVFHADEDDAPPTPPWARLREWGASISRRLVTRSS